MLWLYVSEKKVDHTFRVIKFVLEVEISIRVTVGELKLAFILHCLCQAIC